MSVCFFDRNYEKKNRYTCEYEINDDEIKVWVDYDITLEKEKGVVFNKDSDFKSRDILIIDYKNRRNILLKDAWYAGRSFVWGTPDGSEKTIFKSGKYLQHERYEPLSELEQNFKIKSIRIYSELINEWIGTPSIQIKETENDISINLNRTPEIKRKKFDSNDINVKEILVSDTWNTRNGTKNKIDINININGYIEIVFDKDIVFEDIYEYVLELVMYLHLLCPNRLKINKMKLNIDDRYFDFKIPIREIRYRDKRIEKSVDEDILDFLEKCYSLIPYRNSKTSTRNIYNITLNTNRNLEDNFLMLYRFVECYYKEKGKKNTFISYAIEHNYKEPLTRDVEDITAEMCSLRNHYAHEGYHIKNKMLKIIYKGIYNKITQKYDVNPKNYVAKNVDFDWIYERTEILYKIVIDIIFSDMLKYKKYKFDRQFAEI